MSVVIPHATADLTAPKGQRRWGEGAMHTLLWLCAAASVFTTVGIVLILLVESLQFFGHVSNS